jgi:hypothetical protein
MCPVLCVSNGQSSKADVKAFGENNGIQERIGLEMNGSIQLYMFVRGM